MTLATGRLAAVVLCNRRIVRRVNRARSVGLHLLGGRARGVRLPSNRELQSEHCKQKTGK